ncbi:unnamed protein product [Ambrosiozyma monospora]|uniref:Unnamed protein product n=1 Tax=Ambrosiozyma monospora TaxID=43982 RepID=A0ACB5TKT4_AMBMO|nr:unnamed protein product [Ambrosiozyma monospora]
MKRQFEIKLRAQIRSIPDLFSIQEGDFIGIKTIKNNTNFRNFTRWASLCFYCGKTSRILPMFITLINQTTELVEHSTNVSASRTNDKHYQKENNGCLCLVYGWLLCDCGYTGGISPTLKFPNVIRQLQVFENALVDVVRVIFEREPYQLQFKQQLMPMTTAGKFVRRCYISKSCCFQDSEEVCYSFTGDFLQMALFGVNVLKKMLMA